ncbi:MAG: hypothetical protein HYY13_03685 [Nitrospirae bacterium]|nr:hypothetical protein [Nitrospirota bacterium]
MQWTARLGRDGAWLVFCLFSVHVANTGCDRFDGAAPKEAPPKSSADLIRLDVTIPLSPEAAAALLAVQEQDGLVADVDLNGRRAAQELPGRVEAGVRAGVRAGIRMAGAPTVKQGVRVGVRAGVRLSSGRGGGSTSPTPGSNVVLDSRSVSTGRGAGGLGLGLYTPLETQDSSSLVESPPLPALEADPPAGADEIVHHFSTSFELPTNLASDGGNRFDFRIRTERHADLILAQVSTLIRATWRDLPSASDGSGQGNTSDRARRALEISPEPLESYEVDLPDQDGDGVASLVEVATLVTVPPENGGRPLTLDEAAQAARTAGGPQVTPSQVKTAFSLLAKDLDVRTREDLNRSGTPAPATWHPVLTQADLTAPEARISVDATTLVEGSTVSATLDCNEAACAYRCALDGAEPEPCPATLALTLAPGSHILEVRAVDPFGNRSADPATAEIVVAPAPSCSSAACEESPTSSDEPPPPEPTVEFAEHPPLLSADPSARFHLTSAAPSARFACRLDTGRPFACPSTFEIKNLDDGPHTLAAGASADAAPNLFSWIVDQTPPDAGRAGHATTDGTAYHASATVFPATWTGFSDGQSGVVGFEVNLGTGNDCPGDTHPGVKVGDTDHALLTNLSLADGRKYYFCVRAVDRAGNASAWAVSSGTVVDLRPPVSVPRAPANGAKVAAVGPIGAIADDTLSGVQEVRVSIQRESDQKYWSGGWVDQESWLPVQKEETLSDAELPAWMMGESYTVRTFAIDRAGNVEPLSAQTKFVYDTAPPLFEGLAGAFAVGDSVILSWTPALDNVSAPSDMVYQICQSSTAAGCAAFTSTQVSAAGASSQVVANVPAGPGYFVVRAQDEAGNSDPNLIVRSDVAGFDVWAGRAPMPTPRTTAGGAVSGLELYIVGGYSGGAVLNTVESYNPLLDRWVARQPMPTPREGPAVAKVDERVYVIGGSNGSALNVVEVYDPQAGTWTTRAAMPTPRSHAAACALGGKIIVAGGWNGSALAQVEVYDPASDTWAALPPLPSPRWQAAAVVANGRVYVLGGRYASALSLVDEYNPSGNSWASRPPLPTARYGLAAVSLGSRIIAMGGRAEQANGVVEEINLDAATPWATRSSMPTPRASFVAVPYAGRILAVGGAGAAQVLGVVEAYSPLP